MGRLRAASLLLAALAVGLLLAACGSGGNGDLLPGTTADQINSNLDQVRETAAEGNCEAAEETVILVSEEVDALQKVDKKLKKALENGATKLSEVVSSCGAKQEAEELKAAEETRAEEELVREEEVEAEEEAFEKEQKADEREEREAEKEKAEKEAEQPGPPEEGEESGPNGKAKGNETQEEIEPPTEEEVTPPVEGGPAGGIGPGAEVEGGQ
jgi:septal ring factor EnvC (AmiA/AmiB activator)